MKQLLFMLAQYAIPHRTAGFLIQKVAESRIGWFKNLFISFFIKWFKVDLSESEIEDIKEFENFNEFFTRKLKPSARNFSVIPGSCVSPVDGILADYGTINESTFMIAKKVKYNVYELLGSSDEMSGHFMQGSYMSLYLSPRHYHRVHMPEKGTLKHMRYIPGKFYSVNNTAVDKIDNLYTKNERLVCYFETEHGMLAVVFIGAMFVGSIHTSWQGRVNPDHYAAKLRNWQYPNIKTTKVDFAAGDELGHFQMGSSVILLWSRSKQFKEGLQLNSEIKVGDDIA